MVLLFRQVFLRHVSPTLLKEYEGKSVLFWMCIEALTLYICSKPINKWPSQLLHLPWDQAGRCLFSCLPFTMKSHSKIPRDVIQFFIETYADNPDCSIMWKCLHMPRWSLIPDPTFREIFYWSQLITQLHISCLTVKSHEIHIILNSLCNLNELFVLDGAEVFIGSIAGLTRPFRFSTSDNSSSTTTVAGMVCLKQLVFHDIHEIPTGLLGKLVEFPKLELIHIHRFCDMSEKDLHSSCLLLPITLNDVRKAPLSRRIAELQETNEDRAHDVALYNARVSKTDYNFRANFSNTIAAISDTKGSRVCQTFRLSRKSKVSQYLSEKPQGRMIVGKNKKMKTDINSLFGPTLTKHHAHIQ